MAEVAKGIIDIEINTGSAASQLQAFQAQINAFNLALNKGNKQQLQFTTEYSKKLQEAINKTGLFTAETIRLETAAATLDRTLSKGKTHRCPLWCQIRVLGNNPHQTTFKGMKKIQTMALFRSPK